MRKLISLLAISAFSTAVIGQNQAPQITALSAMADTNLHRITVSYSVVAVDGDPITISLNASVDGGANYAVYADSVSGDAGPGITSGTNKTMVWQYPDSLTPLQGPFSVRLTANDDWSIDYQQIVDQVDTNLLRQDLEWITGIRHRTTGAVHLAHVQDSLQVILNDNGLEVRTHQFPFIGYTGINIVGRKQGLVNSAKTYILDGHYDSVDDAPGADDNGSSIAGILSIMRILSGLQLSHSINFMAFDLEEAGLTGSEEFVASGIMPYEQIDGVINADMIGYYTDVPNTQTIPDGMETFYPELYAELVANEFRGNFIISTPNTASRAMGMAFDSLAALYVPSLLIGTIEVPGNGELVPDSRRSDHVAFWDAGYRALHISDGAESRNPNYHGPGDTLGTIHFGFMADVTKAILATVLQLVAPIHADTAVASVSFDPNTDVSQLARTPCHSSISPNPTSASIRILAPECLGRPLQLQVTNTNGQVLINKQLTSGTEIDLNLASMVPCGVYIVSLTSAQTTTAKRVVVR